MEQPSISLSWGDLVDRLAILEIKAEHIRDRTACSKLRDEIDALRGSTQPFFDLGDRAETLFHKIKAINYLLWDLENAVRQCGGQNDFGENFVTLARCIFKANRERHALKSLVESETKSKIVEHKHYSVDLSQRKLDSIISKAKSILEEP
jgi:hypothetical protein